MGRIAYLGPDYSFSHDLVRDNFPDEVHLPFPSLNAVVEALAKKECDSAVVPFYNTTRKSIEESQIEIIQHKKKVFVCDVLSLEVKHFLCGFGKSNDLTEIRSKAVVFHQISKWQQRNLPGVKMVDYSSTSAAVKSLISRKPLRAAAVGTRSASRKYGVPIIQKNIHNKPNFTLFFVLQSHMPAPEEMDHVLLCVPNVIKDQKQKIEDIAASNGCSITSNWPLEISKKPPKRAYFLEISGRYSTLDLHSTVLNIRNSFPRTFIVGGYKGKCITHLLWAGETIGK